jgi:hypothetical protein
VLSLSLGKNNGKENALVNWADRLIGRGVGLAHHPEGDRRQRFLFLVRVDDGRFGTLDREVWAKVELMCSFSSGSLRAHR